MLAPNATRVGALFRLRVILCGDACAVKIIFGIRFFIRCFILLSLVYETAEKKGRHRYNALTALFYPKADVFDGFNGAF